MASDAYAVIILGAGASKEYGLPLGSELKNKIVDLLQFKFEFSQRPTAGDDIVFEAIVSHAPHYPRNVDRANELIAAGQKIAKALPQAPSIDQYIFNHSSESDVAIVGKIAIARAIQQAERSSTISQFGSDRFSASTKTFDDWNVSETWLPKLFSILVDGCASFADLEVRLQKIKVVSFNYDRVFLHFLFHAFNNYYPKNSAGIVAALKELTIIHPYGSIGPLDWQEAGGLHFGGNLTGDKLAVVASSIKTFNESVADEVQAQTHVAIENAGLIMFLGFGYHDQNMRFLAS